MSLVSRLPSLPYTVYFDNFFTSLKLCEELASKGMGSTGTVRANRIENCPLPPMKKEVRGSYDYKRDPKSGLILVRWQDNNVVTVVSTVHGTFPLSKAPRWSRAEKSRVQLDQPFAISQYNKGMGGVDRLDQNVASYRISIRTKEVVVAIISIHARCESAECMASVQTKSGTRAKCFDSTRVQEVSSPVVLCQAWYRESIKCCSSAIKILYQSAPER